MDATASRRRFSSLRAELGRNAIERRVGVRADGLNRRQADDNDQRQHYRVLNCGWPIFGNEKALHLQSQSLHSILPFPVVIRVGQHITAEFRIDLLVKKPYPRAAEIRLELAPVEHRFSPFGKRDPQ